MRPLVCACVRPLTLSNMNISATSLQIELKFYLKHHLGGERLQYVLIKIGSELWFLSLELLKTNRPIKTKFLYTHYH